MARIFIYLRHGEYDKNVPKHLRDPQPLTDQGERQARAAGAWLRAWLDQRGLSIGRVVWTGRRRTEQTAELALGPVAPGRDRWVHATGGKGIGELMAKVVDLSTDLPEDTALLFSGHGDKLDGLCQHLGPPKRDLADDHGAVLIYECLEQDWQPTDWFPRSGA